MGSLGSWDMGEEISEVSNGNETGSISTWAPDMVHRASRNQTANLADGSIAGNRCVQAILGERRNRIAARLNQCLSQ
jgi:hypothetical protein